MNWTISINSGNTITQRTQMIMMASPELPSCISSSKTPMKMAMAGTEGFLGFKQFGSPKLERNTHWPEGTS